MGCSFREEQRITWNPISADEQISIWKLKCRVRTIRKYPDRLNIDSHRAIIENYFGVIKNNSEFHSSRRNSVLSQAYGLTPLLLLYERTRDAGSNDMQRSVLEATELHQMYSISNNEIRYCNIMENMLWRELSKVCSKNEKHFKHLSPFELFLADQLQRFQEPTDNETTLITGHNMQQLTNGKNNLNLCMKITHLLWFRISLV